MRLEDSPIVPNFDRELDKDHVQEIVKQFTIPIRIMTNNQSPSESNEIIVPLRNFRPREFATNLASPKNEDGNHALAGQV